MRKIFNRLFNRPAFVVMHVCGQTGKQSKFNAKSWSDALEWVDCALIDDTAIICNPSGAVCYTRKAKFSF